MIYLTRCLCAIAILIIGIAIVDSQTFFTAQLTGSQENPAVETDASGTGYFILTEEGLTYHITAEGLEITAAHFHREEIGRNGGIVRNLDFGDAQTISGLWSPTDDAQPLTDELVQELFAGRLYVNLHTSNNPAGEIRGQVLLSNGIGFTASIDGQQETHAVTTEATGAGSFTLTDAGLVFTITVEGLEFTAAHFHNAPLGQDGPVIRTLTNDFNGEKTARGIWRSSDSEPLTEEYINELMAGYIYVNFHTAAYPAGEIRGQVFPNSGTHFIAQFTGSQENPAVETDASGTGYFILTEDGLSYHMTAEGLEITAAHFHREEIGRNGGIVRNLDFGDVQTISGLWSPTDDTQPLTDELIQELFAGRLYVNLHTSDNPAGEIRGQVLLSSGTGFIASIDGDQETHDVITDATGTGSFTLTDAGLVFTITAEGLEFTAAHFHNAPLGQNGPIVRTLTNDFNGGKSVRGIWRSSDSEPLTGELIDELVDVNIYVNFHTPAYPAGEIRGQLATDIITSVREIPGELPKHYVLSQNYPNPFNPSTIIGFELPEKEIITLTVYDLLGRELTVLIDKQEFTAGSYQVEFHSGSLSSGIYFYQLTAGNFKQSKKMILIR